MSGTVTERCAVQIDVIAEHTDAQRREQQIPRKIQNDICEIRHWEKQRYGGKWASVRKTAVKTMSITAKQHSIEEIQLEAENNAVRASHRQVCGVGLRSVTGQLRLPARQP